MRKLLLWAFAGLMLGCSEHGTNPAALPQPAALPSVAIAPQVAETAEDETCSARQALTLNAGRVGDSIEAIVENRRACWRGLVLYEMSGDTQEAVTDRAGLLLDAGVHTLTLPIPDCDPARDRFYQWDVFRNLRAAPSDARFPGGTLDAFDFQKVWKCEGTEPTPHPKHEPTPKPCEHHSEWGHCE